MQKKRREMDYIRLKKELSTGKVRPVYLFCGQEDYLIEEAVDALAKHFLPAGRRDSDCTYVDGQSHDLAEILSMTDTVSLFSGSRLIIVRDAPCFSKGGRIDEKAVLRLLASAQDRQACLIFCAKEVSNALKVVKELKAAGAVFCFDPLKGAALQSWIRDRIDALEKTITPDAFYFFVEHTGSELRTIAAELEKLTVYLGEKQEITKDSILNVCVRAFHADIFALTDAAVYGRTAKALILLKDLLAAGEPGLRIFAMLVRQFRLLSEAKDLLASGENNLASALKLHPYAADKLKQQAAKTDEARLARAIRLLVQCELDIKRGRIEANLALETLVIALGMNSEAPALK